MFKTPNLWQVFPLGVPYNIPSGTCDGIDLSPIDRYVDFHNSAGFANLCAGDFTIEGWFYIAPNHVGVPSHGSPHEYDIQAPLFYKLKWLGGAKYVGWYLYAATVYGSSAAFVTQVHYQNIYYPPGNQHYSIQRFYGASYALPIYSWAHIAMTCHTYDGENPPGTPNINNEVCIFVNGQQIPNDCVPAAYIPFPDDWTSAYDDTSESLTLGKYSSSYGRTFKCNWMRLSSSIRYPNGGGDFTPIPFCDPPTVDVDTIALWHGDELPPVYTLVNAGGYSPMNGTVINP